MVGGLTSSPSGRHRTAAWWWLLLVVVLAVLVTGTVVGLRKVLPPPISAHTRPGHVVGGRDGQTVGGANTDPGTDAV